MNAQESRAYLSPTDDQIVFTFGRGKLGGRRPSLTYCRQVVGPAAASKLPPLRVSQPLRGKIICKHDKPDCDNNDWRQFFSSLGPLEVPAWNYEPGSWRGPAGGSGLHLARRRQGEGGNFGMAAAAAAALGGRA